MDVFFTKSESESSSAATTAAAAATTVAATTTTEEEEPVRKKAAVLTDCPVCGKKIVVEDADRHVNQHFEGGGLAEDSNEIAIQSNGGKAATSSSKKADVNRKQGIAAFFRKKG